MKFSDVFIFLFTLITLNCGKETPEVMLLTVQINASQGGNVSSSGGSYTEGSIISIEALPGSDYIFSGWSNGSQNNPLLITVNSNLIITANFSKKRYPVTVSTMGAGNVEKSILYSAKPSTEYTAGSLLNLLAVPENHWQFTRWSGDISSTDNPIEITVNSTKTIIANFEENLKVFFNHFNYFACL